MEHLNYLTNELIVYLEYYSNIPKKYINNISVYTEMN